MTPRLFPMRDALPIAWEVAETIYGAYCQVHGRSHSLDEIAQRGGWTWPEAAWLILEASRVGWIPNQGAIKENR